MPRLPPVKVKVDYDGSELDRGEAQMEMFGHQVERHLEPAGRAFVTFGEKGEVASLRVSSASAKTSADIDRLTERAEKFATTIGRDLEKGTKAIIDLGEDGSSALAKVGREMDRVEQSAGRTHQSLIDLGRAGVQPMNALIAAVVVLGVVLSPFIITLGTFTAGLVAALSVVGLAAGAFVALGAAVVLLAQRVQEADPATQNLVAVQQQLAKATSAHTVAVQQLETLQASLKGHRATADQLQLLSDLQKQVTKTAYDQEAAQNAVNAAANAGVPPLQRLTDDLGKMADKLGTDALPLARQLVDLLDRLVPKIERVGQATLSWFGEHMPAAMVLAGRAADGFFATLDRVGIVLGRFLEGAVARSGDLGKVLQGSADVGVKALDGLLVNLLRLTDWFIERLPTYGPVVADIMGGIGTVILGLGSAAGAVADWFVEHWPEISSTMRWVWDQLKAGWKDIAPTLQTDLPEALELIDKDLGHVRDKGGPTAKALREMATAAGALADGLIQLAGMVAWVDHELQPLADILNAVQHAFAHAGVATGQFMRSLEAFGFRVFVDAFEGLRVGIDKVGAAIEWVTNLWDVLHGKVSRGMPSPGGGGGGTGGEFSAFQHGGYAPPGAIFTVGEAGPEMGYAPPGGGVVITPMTTNDGGPPVHQQSIVVNVAQTQASPWEIAREAAWAMKTSRMGSPA